MVESDLSCFGISFAVPFLTPVTRKDRALRLYRQRPHPIPIPHREKFPQTRAPAKGTAVRRPAASTAPEHRPPASYHSGKVHLCLARTPPPLCMSACSLPLIVASSVHQIALTASVIFYRLGHWGVGT